MSRNKKSLPSYQVYNCGPSRMIPYKKGIYINKGGFFQTTDEDLVAYLKENAARFFLRITRIKK